MNIDCTVYLLYLSLRSNVSKLLSKDGKQHSSRFFVCQNYFLQLTADDKQNRHAEINETSVWYVTCAVSMKFIQMSSFRLEMGMRHNRSTNRSF